MRDASKHFLSGNNPRKSKPRDSGAIFNRLALLIHIHVNAANSRMSILLLQRRQRQSGRRRLLIRKLGTYRAIAKIAHPAVQVSGLPDGGCGLPLCSVVEVRLTKGSLLPIRGRRMVLHHRSSVLGRAFCQKQ